MEKSMVWAPEQALDSKFRSRATGNRVYELGEANYTISFSSTDRVPPKALAVAQAEREGGLKDQADTLSMK